MKTAILILAFVLPGTASGEVFKCVNAGTVSYSSSPCLSGSVPYNSRRATVIDTTANSVTIPRDSTGRFSLPGAVDGMSTTFTVDTGATYTTISGDIAAKLGIHSCVPIGISHTANGDTPTCRVTVSTLTVGGFNYSNITVYLNPTMQGGALLGNDLLSGFKVSQQANVMVLSK